MHQVPFAATAIDEVGKTAFLIAYWRAQETSHAKALFRDPHAELFVTPDIAAQASQLSRVLPAIQAMVRYRTRYLDDAVRQRAAAGFTQIVILGAGFDTRPLRHDGGAVRFFEVDKPAVLSFKQQALERAGQARTSVFAPCDYLTDDFVGALDARGISRSQPTYFLWEGNTPYLPTEAVTAILATIREHWPRSAVSLDFLSDQVVTRTTGLQSLTEMVERCAALGSPWITGYEGARDIPGASSGWAVTEEVKTSDLARRYGVTDEQNAEILQFYSLCTLDSTAA